MTSEKRVSDSICKHATPSRNPSTSPRPCKGIPRKGTIPQRVRPAIEIRCRAGIRAPSKPSATPGFTFAHETDPAYCIATTSRFLISIARRPVDSVLLASRRLSLLISPVTPLTSSSASTRRAHFRDAGHSLVGHPLGPRYPPCLD